MAGSPIPPNPANPVGGVRLIRKATAAVDARLKEVKRWLYVEIDHIPVTVVNDASYDYQIDLGNLRRITREMQLRLEPQPGEPVTVETIAGYEVGTGVSVTNLSTISDDYTRTITQVLTSQPYMRRVALMRSRVFEEMKGFYGDVATELARILSEAIENGLSPLALKKRLAARFGIAEHRAERIARTEITGALRRARLDEAQDAQQSLGINTGMLWLSALSPTTRASHAARHGEIYTPQQVREFYAQSGEGINCKCGQTEILLKADGSPMTPRIVEKAREKKKLMEQTVNK